MSLETAIRTRLLADGTVSGLISTRLYPLVLPPKPTYPAATFQRITARRLRNLGGAAGRAIPRLQIDSWDEDYDQAWALANAIAASLDGFQAALGGLGTVVIGLENEREDFEDAAGDGAGKGVYRVIQDYVASHRE